MRTATALLAIFVCGGVAVCSEPIPEPSLYLSFDQGAPVGKAIDAGGNVLAEIPLTEGYRGEALLSGSVAVSYPTEKNLLAAGGTVVLWFCPLTWQPLDDRRHDLFNTDYVMAGDAPISHLALYKHGKCAATSHANSFQLHITGAKNVDGKPQVMRANHPIPHATTDGWPKGQWHFLAFTFDQKVGEAVLYADGVEAVRARQNLPEKLGAGLTVGSRFDEPASTAIDEVRLWTKPLTESQIRQIYLEDRKQARR